MSNVNETDVQKERNSARVESELKNDFASIIVPREKDLGEFSVRRVLPSAEMCKVGPWIFFDHMGPAEFPAGNGIDVRPHPHINLATVTYLFEGEIYHRDSLGTAQSIRPGDINLMVAGKGIVHSERETDDVRNRPHRLHGLQLWLALPEEHEEIEPAFYHYPSSDIPSLDVGGVKVRVMMGEAFSVESPVKTFAKTLYCEADLHAGQSLTVPDADERAIYVAEGSVQIVKNSSSGTEVLSCKVDQYSMAVIKTPDNLAIESEQGARIAIIGGEPLTNRYIYWNFVSSDQSRIEQAKHDWRDGKFPIVPGDEEEFIPLPEK